jgi:hypothetical protein
MLHQDLNIGTANGFSPVMDYSACGACKAAS